MTLIRNRLMSAGMWVLAGQAITVLAALVVNALLARLLTPDHLGAYFLVLSLVSVAAVVAQLGLNRAVVRLVAESLGMNQPARAARAVQIALRLGALGALLVAGALALGVTEWLAEHAFDSLVIAGVAGLAALWAMVLAFQSLLAESFRGFHDVRFATLFGGVASSLLSVLLFAGLWGLQGHSNLQQVIVVCIAAGLTNILLAWTLLRSKLAPLGSTNQPKGAQVLDIAWPLWVTGLTLIALNQADLWIIGIFRTPQEVATYGAAARLAVLVGLPLTIVNAVAPSFIAEMYARRANADLEYALRAAATGASIATFLALSLLFFFSAAILGIVYGDYYRQGATVLLILGVGQLANVWTGSCGLVLMMTGHQLLMMGITVTCGTLTIIGAVLLVEPYGATGVASVAATTMLIQNLLMLSFARLKTGIWTHANFSRSSLLQLVNR